MGMTETAIMAQQNEIKAIIRQQRQEKRKQAEQFDIYSILNGEVSERQAFRKMFSSTSSNPKTAIKQYMQYISKLFEAYRNGAVQKESFRHMVYAANQVKNNAIRLNEEYNLKLLCGNKQNADLCFKKPYYANYNDLSHMDNVELKRNFIDNMGELIAGTADAFDAKNTPQIVANCLAIDNFVELTSHFQNL